MSVVIILNTGAGSGNQSWIVPPNWNSANNQIEVIAGGGSGAVGGQNGAATGGGGGGYSKITNLTLTPGSSVTYNLGGPGQPIIATAATAGNAGAATWFNGTTQAASSVAANGGGGGAGGAASSSQAGGTGGSTTGAIGTTLFAGGAGGAYTTAAGATGSATGGGGSAGPSGAGGNGVAITGSASAQASAGGTANNGTDAGGSGTPSGSLGGAGTSGTEFHATNGFTGGSGGGGGGAYLSSNTTTGGNPGFYGGGGGAAVTGAASTSVTSGPGRQGLIIITYTPFALVQSPFWVPRHIADDLWSAKQIQNHQFYIQISVFGAGGQVPTKEWSVQLGQQDDAPMWVGEPVQAYTTIDNFLLNPISYQQVRHQILGKDNLDDPPMWQGTPINSYIKQILINFTQYRAPGQVLQKNYATWPEYYDDLTQWVGEPRQSAFQQLPMTTSFYAGAGQVPTKNYASQYTIDDPPTWDITKDNLESAIISLLTQQSLFGQGGQVRQFRPSWNYDDFLGWEGTSIASNAMNYIPLIPKVLTQVKPPFVVPRPPDDNIWNLQPNRVWPGTLASLFNSTFFGALGQAVTHNWSTQIGLQDDSSMWAGQPLISGTAIINAINPVPNPNPVFYRKDTHDLIDDPAFWQGSPKAFPVFFDVITQTMFGAAGQVVTSRWWPQLSEDDPDSWFPPEATLNAPRAIALLVNKFFGAQGQPPTPKWQFVPEDISEWQSQPAPGNPWFYYSFLTFNKSLQTRPAFYVPRPDDMSGEWSPQIWQLSNQQFRIQTQPSTGIIPPSILWSPDDPDEAAPWTSPSMVSSLASNAGLNKIQGPKPHNVVFPQQVVDEVSWSGSPQGSDAIPQLTSQKITRAGGQAVQAFWTPYVDDPGPWLAAPTATKVFELIPVTQGTVYGQPGQVPPFRPRYDFDDAAPWMPLTHNFNSYVTNVASVQYMPLPMIWAPDDWVDPIWSGSGVQSNQKVLKLHPTPQQGTLQNTTNFVIYCDDNAIWVGRPTTDRTMQNLALPAIYGQGGQAPPFRPNFTSDDPPMFQGAPVPSYIVSNLAQTILGRLGNSVIPFRVLHVNDDQSVWYMRTMMQDMILLNTSLVYPPGSTKNSPILRPLWAPFNYDAGEAPGWVGAPIGQKYDMTNPGLPVPPPVVEFTVSGQGVALVFPEFFSGVSYTDAPIPKRTD